MVTNRKIKFVSWWRDKGKIEIFPLFHGIISGTETDPLEDMQQIVNT